MTGRPDRPEAARADGAQSPPDQARPDAARPLPDGSDAGDERRADALRSGLDAYELTDEDLELLEAADEPSGPSAAPPLPVLAVVGRPNVGKSTLVNRIVGRRVAVVQDTPGVTRDRVSYPASWNGRDFTLVDTGGWELDAAGIHASVARQSEAAVQAADAVVLVVDATVGIADADADIVRMLRRSGRPVVLAANKVDSAVQESDAAVLWGLGLGEPHPVSAMHGRGMGTLLDAVLAALPEESAAAGPSPAGGPRRIAILGRPNVGKSSLLNRLAQAERVVVDPLAGTTRDPVDETVELDGRPWTFVDTAGVRRRVRQAKGADFYASLRTQAALEKAELGLVLLDASEPLTEQDVRVMQQVIDAGRALVLVCNKWDLVSGDRRAELDREMERELVQIRWAERVNLSAKTGWHANRLTRAMQTALDSWDRRIPTGRLNSFLGELAAAHPHPVRGGRQPRILFATPPAALRPVRQRLSGGRIPALHREPAARALRLPGDAHTDIGAGARAQEAPVGRQGSRLPWLARQRAAPSTAGRRASAPAASGAQDDVLGRLAGDEVFGLAAKEG